MESGLHRHEVVCITSDVQRAAEWRQALEHRGAATHIAHAERALMNYLENPDWISAIVVDTTIAEWSCWHHLCAWLRSGRTWPYVVAVMPSPETAQLSDVMDAGFDLPIMGDVKADELATAVEALVKRRSADTASNGHWRLCPVSWQIYPPGSESGLSLTFREREFLLLLGQQPGQPVARDRFVSLFGTTPDLFDTRRLEIMVRRLRNKIRDNLGTDLPINTAHGIGYALATSITILGSEGR